MQALVIIEAIGKAETWGKVLNGIGMRARVVATHGHIASFPQPLWPIGITFASGKPCDPGRTIDAARLQAIRAAIGELSGNAPIFIATDDDMEGDVIALDVIEGLLASERDLAPRIFRARPQALTRDGIVAALDAAEPLRGCAGQILAAAIPGRARAISDRWIGATFSRAANHPVGRVRSALLGAFFLLDKAPHILRGRPEIGEVVLRCRSTKGGHPFIAHVPLDGGENPRQIEKLRGLADRFKGRLVPGVVRPRESLSAAVAPRIGSVRPFNTGDALAYAARHFNLGARQAMRGLQDAYMAGLVSYPRTESRDIGRESAVRVVRLAESCRLGGLDVDVLCDEGGPNLAAPRPRPANAPRRPHEALHPVCDLNPEAIARFETILRAPIPFGDRAECEADEVRDIMAAIVARRAIEAAREIRMEPGDWRPDNTSSVSAEDAALLSDLNWEREAASPLPWSKDLMTGARHWPLRAIATDMMMIEGIGRPSTLAGHADAAEASGEIEVGDLSQPPRPTPFGLKVLARTPKGLWNPGTCRMIELALVNRDHVCREAPGDTMQLRIYRRIRFWFSHLPEEMQRALLEGLGESDGTRTAGVSGPSAALEGHPGAMPTNLAAPAPLGA